MTDTASEVIPAQIGQKRAGRPQGGLAQICRHLGISRQDVQRALKVDSLSDEAKQVARETGLANNRTALLYAAEHPPSQQAAALRAYAPASQKARHANTYNHWLNCMEALYREAPTTWRADARTKKLLLDMLAAAA